MPTSRILLWSGLVALAGGAVLCVLGWYGISGQRFAERQLPYLASCTVPGAALIVAGAVFVVAGAVLPVRPPERPRRPEPGPEEDPAPSSEGPLVRVPGGTLAHRPDCPLVAGKPEAVAVGGAALAPCPVCEPWPP
ncbi:MULTISPECIES: hypothetical protein [unclassified Streptomyces]|uniref:hypothetical protein n=1 Tax=unclassified Streptomyces TaxID=2593676 RepID=UPI0007008EA8|nr:MULTISPECIES: hypothetical protein [unclassified Streptomyces]KQX54963.1 hypothetical protein ASD33_32000 [Streptomyces sp. Root1304]KRA94481.1 hypothetical protein ASE09_31785 [Streptomyces sp. Root66D1]